MPDFDKAAISNSREDLRGYLTFLKKLEVGQVVTLPLDPGETTRVVMRRLNAAATESNMRLARLPGDKEAVRFRVLAPEKRRVNMSEEKKHERVQKAKATRARRQLAQGASR